MKTLNRIIIIIVFGISSVFLSCEKLDIVRTMDTKTDDIEINSSAVVAYGTILDIGDSQIIEHGHCWSTTNEPTVDHNKSELGEISERGIFTSQLTEIIPGIEHYIRSYIFDGTNYVYGNVLSFTISADNIGLVTEAVVEIDESTVEVNSSVGNIGSITFDDHGHCWSMSDPPDINDNLSSYGLINSSKSFSSIINNLNLGRYYIKAYMISEGGVIYSNTVIFESKIKVITDTISVLSDTEVIAQGSIRSLGVESIRDHGHCWSYTTSSPTLNDNHNSLGSTDKLGGFSSNINDLIPGTTYYIRSFSVDGTDVFYGEVKNFVTNN